METAYQEYIRKVNEIVEPYLIDIGEYFYKLGVNIWVKYGEKPISALYLYNPVSESSAMLYFSKRTKRYVIAGADEDREFRPKDSDKLYLPSDMLMSKYTLRWIAEKGVFLSKKKFGMSFSIKVEWYHFSKEKLYKVIVKLDASLFLFLKLFCIFAKNKKCILSKTYIIIAVTL